MSEVRTYRPLGLADHMPFGKYKGMSRATIAWLIENDFEYVRWLVTSLPSFRLDTEAMHRYEDAGALFDDDQDHPWDPPDVG